LERPGQGRRTAGFGPAGESEFIARFARLNRSYSIEFVEGGAMNRIVIGFTAGLLLLTDAGGGSAALRQQRESRSIRMKNISRYDQLGPYDVPVDGNNLSAVPSEVRGFVWEHWAQRRLAKLILISRSKDGRRSTSDIFIEPDETGIWHLSAGVDSTLVDGRAFDDPEFKGTIEKYDEYRANTIERIEIPSNGFSERIVIPAYEKRTPDSYRLRLKDKEGKTIVEW